MNSAAELLAIAILLTQLESNSFQQRQRAQHHLDRMGQVAVPAMQAAWKDTGLDGRQRLEAVIRKRALEHWDEPDEMPWIDALPPGPDRTRIFDCYMTKSRCSKSEPGDYQRYRSATRLYIRDLRQAGCSPQELRALLSTMRGRMEVWYGCGGWDALKPEPLAMPKEVK